MKMSMVLWLMMFGSSLWLCRAEDITTVNGQVFRDVSVESVNPSGIDIGYMDKTGNYVLKGLKFAELLPTTQQRYGYKKDVDQQFEQRVKQYNDTDMDNIALAQQQKIEKIVKEMKDKLSGVQVNIKPDDLRYAIFSLRSSVRIKPVSSIRQGCLVEIEEITSGKPIANKQILLDGVTLPVGESWTGFIYPTGAKANCNGVSGVPVFAESLSRALDIVNKYLNIYGEYAANATTGDNSQAPTNDVAAPDQMLDNSDNYYSNQNTTTDANTQQAPQEQPIQDSGNQQQSSLDYSYYPGYDGIGCSYYYGGYGYGPVNWWWHHHNYPHPHPRPNPRPHPYPRQNNNYEHNNNYDRNYNNFNNRSGVHQGNIGGFHPSHGGGFSGGHGGSGHGGGGGRR